jgi:hypothetical protein
LVGVREQEVSFQVGEQNHPGDLCGLSSGYFDTRVLWNFNPDCFVHEHSWDLQPHILLRCAFEFEQLITMPWDEEQTTESTDGTAIHPLFSGFFTRRG